MADHHPATKAVASHLIQHDYEDVITQGFEDFTKFLLEKIPPGSPGDCPELTVALRKLLECRDAIWRIT